MLLRAIFLFIAIALISNGCIENITKKESQVLARVHDEYLYFSDIEDLLPKNLTPRDSISIVRNLVNDWIKTNVMIYQAEQNLPDSAIDFSKQLEDYRNSLIIYKYETSLIDQTLDTLVSDEEILDYYLSHQNDFQLKENITKAIYVITNNSTENEDRFDQIFELSDTTFFDSLDTYVPTTAISYNTDTSMWISFFDLQKNVPIETYNIELFLKNKRFVKLNDERFIYYVLFFDFKIKDEISPLDFKRNDIYKIILSKRKIQLAKKVRNDIFDRAKANNEFEVYFNQ